MRRILTVLGIGLVLAVSGGLGIVTTSDSGTGVQVAAAPRVVPASGQDLEAAIAALQERLGRVPGDHVSWANIAVAYVEQARTSGDASLYAKADEAAARSLQIEPVDNFSALAATAAIASARHDFGDALADADEALSINPRDLGALAIRVDALTELGRYSDQLKALRAADRLQPSVAIATRYSYAFELRGDTERALDILLTAAANGSRADQAYVLTLAADLLRKQGRLDEARRQLDIVQRAVPGYLPGMVSDARLAVARDDLEGAVDLWRTVVARQPLPEYLTELGELLDHLGRAEEARTQFDVVRATIRLLEAEGVSSDLETALFEADHGSPEAALDQARVEWRRRTSVHAADALAWALHQTGRSRAALDKARLATRLGTPEARFWIHRGQIEAALGMTTEAGAHLRRGLDTDPGLSPWQRDRARTALASLARAEDRR